MYVSWPFDSKSPIEERMGAHKNTQGNPLETKGARVIIIFSIRPPSAFLFRPLRFIVDSP